MKIIKSLLIGLVSVFFKIYFLIFGSPKIDKKLKGATKLYEVGGFSELFSIIRSWDAPYALIEKNVSKKGNVLDLGSGDGLLSNYLAISSKSRKIVGIELNKGRVKDSFKGLKNTKFIYGNILKVDFPKQDTIILAHVLHHLDSFDQQLSLLKKCRERLNKNGKLIIIEIVERPFLKFLLTAFVDYFVLPILFENKLVSKRIFYRSVDEWKKMLKEIGFEAKYKLIDKGMPFSHIVVVAKKK